MKFMPAILLAVLFLLLAGCGNNSGNSAEDPEDSIMITVTDVPPPEPPPEPTPEPSPTPTEETIVLISPIPRPSPLGAWTPEAAQQWIPEDVQALSDENMAYFQTEYFSGTDRSVTANRFLASDYDCPEDVDLRQLFYEGTTVENQAPEHEHETVYTAIADARGIPLEELWRGDLTKITSADAEAVLMRYIGFTIAETNGVGSDLMYYVPEYDAYYLTVSDTSLCQWVTLTAGWQEENGDVWLEYGYSDIREEPLRIMGIVRLTETESGWMIRENHRLGYFEA